MKVYISADIEGVTGITQGGVVIREILRMLLFVC
jgi:D-aminopeptidase